MKLRTLVFSMFLVLFNLSACEYQVISKTPSYSPDIEETVSPSINNCGLLEISTDFKEGQVPKNLKEAQQEYEQWKSIAITVENNTIIATKNKQISYGEIEVENGIIIGTNHGEFGGDIKFKSSFGFEYKILDENFFGFYTFEEKNFVITGLAHMFTDYGYVYELIFSNNKWQAKKIFDIDSQPESFLAVNNDLFIVTKNTLLVLKGGLESKVLIDNAFWEPYFPFFQNGFNFFGPLAPRSMVYGNNSIYIGMYGGMYAYDLNTGTDKWYDFLPER